MDPKSKHNTVPLNHIVSLVRFDHFLYSDGDMFCRALYWLFSRASCETQKHWGNGVIHHGWIYSSKLNFSPFELKAFYIFRLSFHQSHWKKTNIHGFCKKCLFPCSSLWCFSMLLEENRGSLLFVREKKLSWEGSNGASSQKSSQNASLQRVILGLRQELFCDLESSLLL